MPYYDLGLNHPLSPLIPFTIHYTYVYNFKISFLVDLV